MRKLIFLALVLVCNSVKGQGFAPDKAASRMLAAEGIAVSLVASEPLVRQPVAIECDDRGRLWVIQYLQYPNPEGLKRTQVDRYSRTIYDRVPEPPPRGPKGADRITILSDTNGDGVMDRGHDFVSGLNLTSGLAFGHGGVFVLNVPYLLFYPDHDRDDKPDSDPEVLLTGFGMQDAHSVANSLTWGPDGWLYGCQGSTVTSNIRGIEFQQGVWRYHPRTKAFELFCEGGGNSWGLDFDADGQLFYSTNYGGFVLLHAVQGGKYVKSFAKHGQLHNPYAYGYFEHAPHKQFFGGHVTVGGIVYQGGSLPARFHGQYIAGDLLGHAAYFHRIVPHGSTYRTETVGQLLDSHDSWFAPTDVTVGMDGSVLIADWHDARTAHPDPDAQWDRSNGRIIRLANQSAPPVSAMPEIDLAQLSTNELLAMHADLNQFKVRRARQELVRRKSIELLPRLLEKSLSSNDASEARESFWTFLSLQDPTMAGSSALYAAADRLLSSPHAVVRYWTVRWLGDCGEVTEQLAHQLDALAETEDDLHVRSQLASTAARLPAHVALPIINANINRDIDSLDPFMPLQWWWALERHAVAGREEVMKRFTRPTLWKSELGRDYLLTKLVRRYMAEGNAAGLDSVLRLLKAAPTAKSLEPLWFRMVAGWGDVHPDARVAFEKTAAAHPLAELVKSRWRASPTDSLARLGILFGDEAPRAKAIEQLSDRTNNPDVVGAVLLLKDHPHPSAMEPLLSLYQSNGSRVARVYAFDALAKYDSLLIAEAIIKQLPRTDSTDGFHASEIALLCSRPQWAVLFLDALDRREIAKEKITLDQVRLLAALGDPAIDKRVETHWGKLTGATPEEKLAEVRRLNNDLRADNGDVASGQLMFKKHCAVCHRFQNEGGTVGPDLTSSNRKDRAFMLVSLVDPSSVIRKEYVSVIVRTADDRILTGVPLPSATSGLKLTNAKGEVIELSADEVAEVKTSSVSIMPEDLYKQLTPQQLRDLFAYLSQ